MWCLSTVAKVATSPSPCPQQGGRAVQLQFIVLDSLLLLILFLEKEMTVQLLCVALLTREQHCD